MPRTRLVWLFAASLTPAAGCLDSNPLFEFDGGPAVDDAGPRDLPPPGDCEDGVDCFCDRVQDPQDASYDRGVFFCEDFEHPNLPNRGGRGRWRELYGPGMSICNVNPEGPDNDYGSFGRGEDDCVDIVDEGSYGCEVPGEDDCVLDGSHALGHRLRVSDGSFEDTTGGIVGELNFTPVRTFGYTMAVRYSPNYRAPGEGGTGPAHKMNEFGQGFHCLIGCSTNNGVGRNHPYRGSVFGLGDQPLTILRGDGHIQSDSGSFGFVPDQSRYKWGRTHGAGQWMCLQIHWSDWGTSNAEFRGWMDGELVMHFQDLDMTNLTRDREGIGTFFFNHYYNGSGTDGYPGPTLAYRYEDNVVMTSSDEPVSCGAIGFTF